MPAKDDLLQQLPAIGQLLQDPRFGRLSETFGRTRLKIQTQHSLETMRTKIQQGQIDSSEKLQEELNLLPKHLQDALSARQEPSLRRLINATGILIHTNLGRAPLAPAAAQAMVALASSYSNLEYQVAEGRRGHRDQHFEERLMRVVTCEAATVCNNNAAAVFLILNTLAEGKEVLVSRGELVEIGGSFRIPAILEKSGARLREVGTTNKTRISDYQEAINEQTGLILKVHTSNYRIVGFTAAPTLDELVTLARRTSIPLVEDAGSGQLYPSDHIALRREPVIETSLAAGVDLVSFSGDKLLGGPQAGIIAGRKTLIERIRKNPLMRTLRVDKMTYATLEHTLIEIEKGERGESSLIWRILNTPVEDLRVRAQNLQSTLANFGWPAELVETSALVGGGSAPEEAIPSIGLLIQSPLLSPNAVEHLLRTGSPGIIARIQKEHVVLDLRTVLPEQDPELVAAFRHISGRLEPEEAPPLRRTPE